jgi:cytochrome P450
MGFMTDIVERPAHVPEAAVFDFDYHRDPGLFVDPHDRVIELVGQASRLFWTPHNGGHWMAFGYEPVARVLREPEAFSSALMPPEITAMMENFRTPDGRRIPKMVPIFLDPPDHTRLRAPLAKAFSPNTVIRLKGRIEELADELVEAVLPLGHCDFLTTVIEQLPVRIFLAMMGLPDDRIEEFRALVRAVFEPREDEGDEGRAAQVAHMRKISDAMLPDILARQKERRDDIISLLWDLEIDGEPMTLDLMEDYCSLLFLAGLDTVINAMAHGMRHLAAHPEMQAELRAQPERIVKATEELMRRYTLTAPIRRVVKDVEIDGRQLKAGDIVVTYLSAADLDPVQFPDPAQVDIDRENLSHLIFGAGPHRCLGAHLARVELHAFYETVLAKLPEFRLDPDKRPVFHAGNMLAISSLPIRWD